MKAAYIREPGPPSNIQFGEVATPSPEQQQLLVRVQAVSVNPIDTYIRGGANYWPLPSPFILGCDFAGTVESVGAEVTDFQVGDRVWGSNQGLLGRQGTFAEYACVDQQWAYKSPAGVSDDDLAACSLVGITAHLGLFGKAQLASGETIFVRGGAGGVGAMVLQMSKAVGATVITTAGSPEKAKLCQQLGADEVIQYNNEPVDEALLRLAPDGVDVFWETLREPNFDLAVSSMAESGRMVLMAGRDARPPFPVGPFYVKGLSLHGVVMFKATADAQRAAAEDIANMLADGRLKSVIDRRLPLSQAAEAHDLQQRHTVQQQSLLAGKIVLNP